MPRICSFDASFNHPKTKIPLVWQPSGSLGLAVASIEDNDERDLCKERKEVAKEPEVGTQGRELTGGGTEITGFTSVLSKVYRIIVPLPPGYRDPISMVR